MTNALALLLQRPSKQEQHNTQVLHQRRVMNCFFENKSCLPLRLLLVLSFFFYSASLQSSSWKNYRSLSRPPSSSSLFQTDPINKLEKAAIKRFTVGYEKLCKNCPTRLQPRVDTLTEMIMGLSTEDRNNLLSAVAQRIEEDAFKTQEETVGLRTPEEVYDFQVAGAVNAPVETKVVKIENFQISRMDGDAEQSREVSQEDKEQESVKKQQKLIAKMDQTKAKLRKSDAKLAEIDCLLQATKSLLSKDKRMRDIAFDTGFFDEEEIEKLSSMNRSELKLQLLRYRAQQAKFERSKAKTRAKRYAASLQLTTKRITPV